MAVEVISVEQQGRDLLIVACCHYEEGACACPRGEGATECQHPEWVFGAMAESGQPIAADAAARCLNEVEMITGAAPTAAPEPVKAVLDIAELRVAAQRLAEVAAEKVVR